MFRILQLLNVRVTTNPTDESAAAINKQVESHYKKANDYKSAIEVTIEYLKQVLGRGFENGLQHSAAVGQEYKNKFNATLKIERADNGDTEVLEELLKDYTNNPNALNNRDLVENVIDFVNRTELNDAEVDLIVVQKAIAAIQHASLLAFTRSDYQLGKSLKDRLNPTKEELGALKKNIETAIKLSKLSYADYAKVLLFDRIEYKQTPSDIQLVHYKETERYIKYPLSNAHLEHLEQIGLISRPSTADIDINSPADQSTTLVEELKPYIIDIPTTDIV